MKRMEWTKEQQEAIELRDKNILVSAAAGSGKTAVLVERIKTLILDDYIPIDQMLIVTFSNAAASEMREKIVNAISKQLDWMDKEPLNQKKSAFLREQLNKIHRANISTFHAFAMEVIRRYFYLIDIEPNFKICDEAQKTILQAEAMEWLFEQLFESCNQDFLDFLRKFGKTKNDNQVKELILEVHRFIQSIPDSFGWFEKQVESLRMQEDDFLISAGYACIRQDIRATFLETKQCFEQVGEILEQEGIESLIPKWKLDMEVVSELIDKLDFLKFDEIGEMLQTIKFQTFAASKGDKEAYAEVKDIITGLRDQGKQGIKKISLMYLSRPLSSYLADINCTYQDGISLLFLVKEFDRLYKEKKRTRGVIDFNDIEHYALKVLDFSEPAKEYREKFQYIFIDEYQDSNIVQETLVSKIKRENNLFMVGDVKQSIYKFRLAEPELFIGKYEAFRTEKDSSNQKIDLNKNFRSKGNVVGAVNDVFSQIMTKDLSGLAYDEAAALYQGVSYTGEFDYPVDLYVVDESKLEDLQMDDEINEMKKAEMEAYAAATVIRQTKGKFIYDVKKGKERLIENRDIVILLRGVRGYADIYSETLKKEGISTYVDNSDGYFDTLEIEVFLNLLRIIDNGRQDIPFLSVLRSPVFGFSIEEMSQIRIANREGSYYEVFSEYASLEETNELSQKCSEVLALLGKWKKEATFTPMEDFLWMLIRETGYYEYIGGIPGGSQRQANLRALVDKAAAYQSNQMKGIFGFINYIDEMKKRKVPIGQVNMLGENDDVIRIMTIHKSKGLEFPVVLVAGLGRRFNRDSDSSLISLHKDIGIGIRMNDPEHSCYKKTLLQMVIEQKKRRESLAEELRILYVAFTRAMDHLILLGTTKDVESVFEPQTGMTGTPLNGKSFLEFILAVVSNTRIESHIFTRNDIQIANEEVNLQKQEIRNLLMDGFATVRIPETIEQSIEKRLGFQYAYQKSIGLKSKFSVTELNRINRENLASSMDAPTLATPMFLKDKNIFTSAERGTILHKVMELLDFSRIQSEWNQKGPIGVLKNIIFNEVERMIENHMLTKEESTQISYQKILRFFQSEIGNRMIGATTIWKEVSFNMKQEMDGETIIVQGTIDCYFQEGDEFVLLDYKSNYIYNDDDKERINHVVSKYKSQLEFYKQALERIRGIKVKEMYLYLFAIDEAVLIS